MSRLNVGNWICSRYLFTALLVYCIVHNDHDIEEENFIYVVATIWGEPE